MKSQKLAKEIKLALISARLAEIMEEKLMLENAARQLNEGRDEIITPPYGVIMIGNERSQHEGKGFTEGHDDAHENCELVHAAKGYADAGIVMISHGLLQSELTDTPTDWPWTPQDWKPKLSGIENLAVAGSLIAAEIDRELRYMSSH